MKIIFNAVGCGLGNNGGSNTIIKSANALQSLGHEVIIADSGKNKNSWVKLETPHLIVRNMKDIPPSDVAISTGFKTCALTMKFPAKLKVNWIRGWETWSMTEEQIKSLVLNSSSLKLVNSIGLQKKLISLGVQSEIIRPGNDFTDYYPRDIRQKRKLIIGGLYHEKHRTKRSEWVVDAVNQMRKTHKNIELWMMGEPATYRYMGSVNRYISQPKIKEKNKFLNQIHIWLSPSCLEGLHIVPQEAMLTGACVVGTDAPLAGIEDYIEDGKTGFISRNNLGEFIKKVQFVIKRKDLREQVAENGRQKIIEMGSRKENMQKMVEIFERRLK